MNLEAVRLSLASRAEKLAAYPVEHAGTIYAYTGALYFMEIIYLMVAIAFLYGRLPAVVVGFLLSGLLCVQLIGLAMKKEPFRKVQLLLMEVHAAYSIPFLIGALSGSLPAAGYDLVFTALRCVLVAAEVYGIFLLTDERVRASFA